jgi:ribosome-associated protein
MLLDVGQGVLIPEEELGFTTSRSGGPGGQNVNKVNTRITLLFDLTHSPSLSAEQRELIRRRLAGRVNRAGILRVVSQRHRTQLANRDAAVKRFAELMGEALVEDPERVPVPIPEEAKARRLEQKRHRSMVKRGRVLDLTQED